WWPCRFYLVMKCTPFFELLRLTGLHGLARYSAAVLAAVDCFGAVAGCSGAADYSADLHFLELGFYVHQNHNPEYHQSGIGHLERTFLHKSLMLQKSEPHPFPFSATQLPHGLLIQSASHPCQ